MVDDMPPHSLHRAKDITIVSLNLQVGPRGNGSPLPLMVRNTPNNMETL